ncbi:MAG TPA: 4'-phosphopantetheinyl transferase superfamily protein [Segetibacter sp.]|jgi:4'-phosphopantetheinyl transferase
MIDILYIKNEQKLPLELINLIEELIGEVEREKGRRYIRWQDRQAYLLGKYLLAKLLKKYRYSTTLLKKLEYTPFNRPFINTKNLDFNVSHSGNFVVCAFSLDQVVGIDIEQIKAVDFKDFSYILSRSDNDIIRNASNQYSSFFKIWSMKEAILKADGCGLVDNLDKLQINGCTSIFNQQKFFLKEFEIHPQYASFVASVSPIENLEINEVSTESFSTFIKD